MRVFSFFLELGASDGMQIRSSNTLLAKGIHKSDVYEDLTLTGGREPMDTKTKTFYEDAGTMMV